MPWKEVEYRDVEERDRGGPLRVNQYGDKWCVERAEEWDGGVPRQFIYAWPEDGDKVTDEDTQMLLDLAYARRPG